MDFYPLRENIKKQLLNTGLDAAKTASKKVLHKAGEFLGNKIADAITKSNDDNIEKQEPIEEVIIPSEKKGNIKQFEKSILIMEHHKISKLLNDPTVSKFVTKKWIKVNDLSSRQYSVNKNVRFKTSMLRSD